MLPGERLPGRRLDVLLHRGRERLIVHVRGGRHQVHLFREHRREVRIQVRDVRLHGRGRARERRWRVEDNRAGGRGAVGGEKVRLEPVLAALLRRDGTAERKAERSDESSQNGMADPQNSLQSNRKSVLLLKVIFASLPSLIPRVCVTGQRVIE